jgi:hypothetical protein
MEKYPGDYPVRATEAAIRQQLSWAAERLRWERQRLHETLDDKFLVPVRVIEAQWVKQLAAKSATDSAADIMNDYINWHAQHRRSVGAGDTAAAVLAACPPDHGALRIEGARVSRRAPRPATATTAAGTTGTSKTHSSGSTGSPAVDKGPAHCGTRQSPVVASTKGPARSNLGRSGTSKAGQHRSGQDRRQRPAEGSSAHPQMVL